MAKFPFGQLLATPGALAALEESGQGPAEFLARHSQGDWGEICAADWQLNDSALVDGSRLLSAYRTSMGSKVWIITEAADDQGSRAATTILLPEEY
jgi:hypothetical protein